MPYIDFNYYTNTFIGTPIPEDEFDGLSERASDLIDMLTSYVLRGLVLEEQPLLFQENVKKAVAAQVEYMATQGGELSVHGGSPSSVSIGNFSYQSGNDKQRVISPMVINYLKPLGLLYRGVSVYGC